MLFISSVQAHMEPDHYGAVYGTSKMAATFLFQKMADELSPEKVQIISFHPGAVLTEPVRKAGYDENTLPWDNSTSSLLHSTLGLPLEKGGHSLLIQHPQANLPASFCVWAATNQAAFLHGRFVWARFISELSKSLNVLFPCYCPSW